MTTTQPTLNKCVKTGRVIDLNKGKRLASRKFHQREMTETTYKPFKNLKTLLNR